MGRPMPEEIRRVVRAKQHPARAVRCPHCGAEEHRPCRVKSRNVILTLPHPARISAWARIVACCPACQVEPGVPCHEGGRPLLTGSVHDQRRAEAEVTA